MDAYLIAAGMMVASGSIHAVVNAIVKGRGGAVASGSGGHDIMAGRAATHGLSALLLLPAIAPLAALGERLTDGRVAAILMGAALILLG